MKNLFPKLAILACIALLFTSCDPTVEFHRVINNDSGYDLILYPNDSIGYTFVGDRLPDSLYIPNNSFESLYTYIERGGISYYTDCPNDFDSIRFVVDGNPNLSVTLDPMTSSNWSFNLIEESKYGGGECECVLYIEPQHIN